MLPRLHLNARARVPFSGGHALSHLRLRLSHPCGVLTDAALPWLLAVPHRRWLPRADVFCASSYVPENMRAKSVSVLNLGTSFVH